MNNTSNFGFEVLLNGEHLCNAGIDTDRHVITCILTSMRRLDEPQELDLMISGLNSVTEEHADWVDVELKEGDTISIKVIAANFDPPRRIKPKLSKEKSLNDKLKYYYKLKEELKEHLE